MILTARAPIFAAAGFAILALACSVQRQARADGANDPAAKHLVILYKKDSAAAPNRLDPTVQATTLALQHELLNRQYQITEPSPEVYRAMDQGPDVVVSFAPGAGMSLVYSIGATLRPMPGTDLAIAEVRVTGRVFIGSNLLSAEEGRGQIQTRTDPALQKYGEARGYEIAAQRAAADLVSRVHARLSGLNAAEVERMIAGEATDAGRFALVDPAGVAGEEKSAAPPPGPTTGPPSGAPPPAAAGAAAPPGAKHWLLTIGVSDFSKASGFAGAGTHANDLPGTPIDVKNVQRTLKAFGFDEATTIQLFDRSATTNAVRAALERLTASAGPGDVVVLYISSHGMERNFGRLGVTIPVFYDTDVAADPYTLLDYAELVKLFARIPARQLIMLIDACYSGGATQLMTTVAISARSVSLARSGGSPDLAQVLTAAKDARADIAVMSGARTDEEAVDLGPTLGGLFTSKLMAALAATRGATPLEELYRSQVWTPVLDYCKSHPAGFATCQHPVLGYGGAGNLIRFADR